MCPRPVFRGEKRPQVVGPAGFGPCAGELEASKGFNPHSRPGYASIDMMLPAWSIPTMLWIVEGLRVKTPAVKP